MGEVIPEREGGGAELLCKKQAMRERTEGEGEGRHVIPACARE